MTGMYAPARCEDASSAWVEAPTTVSGRRCCPPQLCAARRTCCSAGAQAAAVRRVCHRPCLRGSRAAHAALGPVGHPQPGAGAAVAHSARPQPGWRAALPRASLPSPARGARPGLQVGSPGRPSGPSSTVHEHLALCAQAARPEASDVLTGCLLASGSRRVWLPVLLWRPWTSSTATWRLAPQRACARSCRLCVPCCSPPLRRMLAPVLAVRNSGAVLLRPWRRPSLDSRNVGVDLRGTLLRGREKQFKLGLCAW